MNIFQSFYSKFATKVLSPDVYTQIMTNSLLNVSADFNTRLDEAFANDTSFVIPVQTREGENALVDVVSITNFEGNDSDTVEVSIYDNSGAEVGVQSLPYNLINELVSNEMELAGLESAIIPALYTVRDDSAMQDLIDRCNNVTSSVRTDAGLRFKSYIDSIVHSVDSIDVARSMIISGMFKSDANDPSAPFTPSKIGSYTNRCGWAILFNIPELNMEALLEKVETVLHSVFATIVDVVENSLREYFEADRQFKYKIGYWFSTWGIDEFASTNNPTSFYDCGVANGFTELSVTFSDAEKQKAIDMGCSRTAAIAIPTIGATWYLYLNENDTLKLGHIKHLYKGNVADYLLRCASFDGNEWDMIPVDNVDIGVVPPGNQGAFADAQARNQVLCQSLRDTETLIPLGLMLIGSQSLKNRYFQEPDLEQRADYVNMFTKDIDTYTRSSFIDSVIYQGTTFGQGFAKRMILEYLDNYTGLSSDVVVSHLLVSSSLHGFYTANDDALTKSALKTKILNVGKVSLIAVSAVAAMVGFKVLKNNAFKAYVSAQRALYDPSLDVKTVKKLTRKANMLSTISGLTTETAGYVVTDGISDAIRDQSSSQESLSGGVTEIIRLIAG